MDAFARDPYASSSQTRALSLWAPRLTSGESEFSRIRDVSTARARDLITSSAYAANAIRIHKDNVIGPRYTLALRPQADRLGITPEQAVEWTHQVEQEWEAYANSPTFDADAARVLSFPWLLHMIYESFLTSGDGLAVLKYKDGYPGSFKTCMQVIEPERLSNPADKVQSMKIRNGVEFGEDGEPIAYHIRKIHPADVYLDQPGPDAMAWLRIERATAWGRPIVLHMIDRRRAELRRGISSFVSVLRNLKLLDEYDGAEVESAILRTMVASVIKTELPDTEAANIMGAAPTAAIAGQAHMHPRAQDAQSYLAGISHFRREQGISINGARVMQLLPGEDLELKQAQTDGLAFEAFQHAIVRKIAAGAGTSAESLSRDFGQMSYASAMVSIADIWRSFLVRREQLNRQVAIPFASAWLEEAIDSKRVPLPTGKFGTADDLLPMRNAIWARSTFMSWGMPSPDPLKKVQAQKEAIMAGLSTHQEEAYADGLDYREVLGQAAAERKLKETLGIPQLETLPPGQPERLVDAQTEQALRPPPAKPAPK
jgi:lambda family phage portal protein